MHNMGALTLYITWEHSHYTQHVSTHITHNMGALNVIHNMGALTLYITWEHSHTEHGSTHITHNM